MKCKIHIPTEQYGFVEIEVDEVDDLQEIYTQVKRQFEPSTGLDDKHWRIALDKYITTNELESYEYESMNKDQKMVIQEIKKSVKRINYKQND